MQLSRAGPDRRRRPAPAPARARSSRTCGRGPRSRAGPRPARRRLLVLEPVEDVAFERAAGGVLAVEGEVAGSAAAIFSCRPATSNSTVPTSASEPWSDLADVGQADPVLGQALEFGRRQLDRRQPGQVQRLPEGVAGPGVIGPRPGRGGAGRGAAEDDPQARLQHVSQHLVHARQGNGEEAVDTGIWGGYGLLSSGSVTPEKGSSWMGGAERSPRMRWEDGVVYGLLLAGIYLLVGVLFFYAGKEKIFDGLGAPAGSRSSSAAPFWRRSPASTPPGRSSGSSSSPSSFSPWSV